MSGLTQQKLDTIADEIRTLGSRLSVDDEAMKAMHDIYIKVYAEHFDPGNEGTARFVQDLIPHIRTLNDKFKFKR